MCSIYTMARVAKQLETYVVACVAAAVRLVIAIIIVLTEFQILIPWNNNK